jgi:YebC/PmpR family DNA-binding regulatory protein
MSGHNKWSQIKHRKGAQDAKKSMVFSKMLALISIAAKTDPNPATNARLRSLIEKAREANVPNDNISRAINRATEQKDLKEFVFECIGPEGISIVVEGITDNSNRTIQQLRTLAQDLGAKPADSGSLMWGFELVDGENGRQYRAKFPQPVSEEIKAKLEEIVAGLDEHDDVQRVVTSAQL